jgi:hypothetical protein
MAALQAGTGFGGAGREFYGRHRIPIVSVVLSLVGIATGTATAVSLLQNAVILDPLVLGAGAVLAAVCCEVQTRHFGIAALTALAPIPGLIWAAPLSDGASFGAVPFLAYAFGFAVAALLAQSIVERALDGEGGEYPWRAAGMALGLTLVLGVLWFWGTDASGAAVQAVVDAIFCAASALVLLPMGASLLHLDEGFVARANRVRERRQRIFERLALVATPRWALSFTGIAFVFLALGWFGAEPQMRTGATALLLRLASAVVVIVGAGIFARGWREGLAVGLTGAVVCLVSLWATIVGTRDVLAPVGVLLATSVALFLALHAGRRALRHAPRETPLETRRRTIEDTAASQIFAGAGALSALLPAVAVWPGYAPFAIALFAAGFCGIVFAPAAVTALESIFPRRRSVEDLYGSRRKRPAAQT